MKTLIKIPTILGLLLLVGGVAVGVLLVQQNVFFGLGASPEEQPQDLRITNITDTGFTVSWTTAGKNLGAVLYGNVDLDKTTQDTLSTPANTHRITLSGLHPKTKYSFKILSGKTQYGKEGANGSSWTQSTGQTLDARASDVINGTVTTSSGENVSNALVYVNVKNSTPLSGITDEKGYFSIALSTLRSNTLTSYTNYTNQTVLSISVQSGTGTNNSCCAKAQIAVGNSRPMPTLILGQTQNYLQVVPGGELTSPQSNVQFNANQSPSPFETGQTSRFTPLGGSPTPQNSFTITSPKDNETFSINKPQFFGTAPQGSKVTITIKSQTLTKTVTAGNDGTWQWTPTSSLANGNHTLTVTTKDAAGSTQTLARTFVISTTNSSLPTFTASSSAIVASPTATPRPTLTPRPSPTSTLRPTPTPKPTLTPRPTSVTSTASAMPISGDLTITLSFFILGIGFLAIGLFVFRNKTI